MKNNSGNWIRTIVTLICVLAIVGTAVGGTIAYVSDITGPVVNTFVMGDILEGDFILQEHEAKDDDLDGEYELDPNSTTTENEYAVMPGVNIPKDPFVRTTEALTHDAYVFIEVVDNLECDAMSFEIDSAWSRMTGVTGPNGGDIYVLAANDGIVEAGDTLNEYILSDNQIVVANDTITDAPGSLTFYGYMIQTAGFSDASEAWEGF